METKRLLFVYELEGRRKAWENLKKLAEVRIGEINREIQAVLMDEETSVVTAQIGCERCD